MTRPVVLVGEAMGANEVKLGKGFVGAAGIELLKMLHEAQAIELTSEDWEFMSKYWNTGDPEMLDMIWNMHPEVYRTNVFQQHPPGNKVEAFCGGKGEGIFGYPALTKSKYVREEYIPELERLGDEICNLDPNLVVCLGNTPLWALAGRTGITKVRGTTLLSTHTATGYKLLATYHPSAVNRQWELRPTTVIDLMRVKVEREYPEIRRPKREIWIEPEIEDLYEFDQRHLKDAAIISVDIETAGNQITCIGFSPSAELSIVIPIYDGRAARKCYWKSIELEKRAWSYIKEVLERKTPKVFQNGLYDITFLWRAYGIKVMGATHDTMLLHHALQPESLKSLGFLGSIYTDEGAWKHMRKKHTTIKRDE